MENAVKHGVGAHAGEGVVRVIARREGASLRLEVEDRCQGEHLGIVEAGTGIALQTLRERLAKRFGEAAAIELVPHDRGMCARVTVPWIETAQEKEAA